MLLCFQTIMAEEQVGSIIETKFGTFDSPPEKNREGWAKYMSKVYRSPYD